MEKLNALKNTFESNNFKQLYNAGESSKIHQPDEVLRKEIIEIVNLVHQDEFELNNNERLFTLVKELFAVSEDYFHIIPQLFIQYFWNNSINKKKPVLDIETKLYGMIKKFSEMCTVEEQKPQNAEKIEKIEIKLTHANPPNNFKVNLFNSTTSLFNNYEALYS